MTSRRTHLLSVLPLWLLALAIGHSPLSLVWLVAGAVLPELDSFDRRFHRSWALHTFLVPALAYRGLDAVGAFEAVPGLLGALNLVSVGAAAHFFADYVYPREQSHPGAAWPVRPSIGSAPWGLVLLGLSWALQWFVYLVPEFLPWLVGL